jgi:hypothetical protein
LPGLRAYVWCRRRPLSGRCARHWPHLSEPCVLPIGWLSQQRCIRFGVDCRLRSERPVAASSGANECRRQCASMKNKIRKHAGPPVCTRPAANAASASWVATDKAHARVIARTAVLRPVRIESVILVDLRHNTRRDWEGLRRARRVRCQRCWRDDERDGLVADFDKLSPGKRPVRRQRVAGATPQV